MVDPGWNPNIAIAETARLIAPGVLGFYTQFEATEIFAIPAGQSTPVNVFSILTAEDRLDAPLHAVKCLNESRIRLKTLKGWVFGIQQYSRPIAELTQLFEDLCKTGEWKPSGESLQVGKVSPIPLQFVPPDSVDEVPWNRVLKNNFWNGSYLLEWADLQKTALEQLFQDPPRLQELSDCVRRCIPIGIARLSDRLGNIVVQLPVTALLAKFTKPRTSSDFVVKVAWNPKATPRPLRATCEMEFDGLISGYTSSEVNAPETRLAVPPGQGLHRGVIWDDQNRLILAATRPSAFMSEVRLNLNISDPEPRVFSVQESDGSTTRRQVPLLSNTTSMIGKAQDDGNGGWTQRRMYREELSRLAAERRFVQYNPRTGQQCAEHEKALGDIRLLINHYGQAGAWLWDPYLSAHDVLETLFYCQHSNADLRALTSALEPANACSLNTGEKFIERQRATFESAQSNVRGLRLQYRAKIGPNGWGFHDRFLIFPSTIDRAALAWSLGTSVNSLGTQHHILQRVDDGQIIMDAFLDLWNQLSLPEHLVWKTS